LNLRTGRASRPLCAHISFWLWSRFSLRFILFKTLLNMKRVSLQTCWNSTCFTWFIVRFISHTSSVCLFSSQHQFSQHRNAPPPLWPNLSGDEYDDLEAGSAKSLRWQHFPRVSERCCKSFGKRW
jgi:hypothetical protein